jgi:general stress protein 26
MVILLYCHKRKTMSELKKKIQSVLKKPQLASLATLTEDGKPWVRYVTVICTENFHLFFCTDINTRKARQIMKNPEVHLSCGDLDPPDNSVYLQIQGRAAILSDQKTKTTHWNEEWYRYFKGPEDPNYVMVRIEPYRIEYNNPGSFIPEIWE